MSWRSFSAEGHEVQAFDVDPRPGAAKLGRLGISIRTHAADVTDFVQVASTVDRVRPDYVINTSVSRATDRPALMTNVNVMGLVNLLEAARMFQSVPGRSRQLDDRLRRGQARSQIPRPGLARRADELRRYLLRSDQAGGRRDRPQLHPALRRRFRRGAFLPYFRRRLDQHRHGHRKSRQSGCRKPRREDRKSPRVLAGQGGFRLRQRRRRLADCRLQGDPTLPTER